MRYPRGWEKDRGTKAEKWFNWYSSVKAANKKRGDAIRVIKALSSADSCDRCWSLCFPNEKRCADSKDIVVCGTCFYDLPRSSSYNWFSLNYGRYNRTEKETHNFCALLELLQYDLTLIAKEKRSRYFWCNRYKNYDDSQKQLLVEDFISKLGRLPRPNAVTIRSRWISNPESNVG